MGYKIANLKEDVKLAIIDYLEESCCASIVPRPEMFDELCDIIDEKFKRIEQ